MAKKKNNTTDLDTELDFKDLDSLEDDIDFGDLENIDDDRNPSKAEISKELLKEAGKGFLDSVIKKTAEKSLPDEYSNNYYTAMEFADFAKETFDTNRSKINKSLYRLGKEVKKIIPFQSKLLNNFLEKYESDFEASRVQTEEELRDNSIQSTISSIFDKQLEIQKALEAKREAEEEVEKKQTLSLSKINLDILTSIDSNISTQTAFTLQISKEYYRKSLELQYKSYFIQADMLKTMRDYYKGFSLQLDNIVKNTGLPDFVKLKSTEAVKEITRTNIIQSVQKELFGKNEYLENVKRRISNLIKEKVSSITDFLDSGADILSNINMTSESGNKFTGALLPIFAALGGGALGEKLADKISPKIKNKIKDNAVINTGANYLELLARSPSLFFSSMKEKVGKKIEEYQDESTPLRFLASKLFSGAGGLLDVIDPGLRVQEIKKQSILAHNEPAIFDNKVHRSITEVIPLYLAKILTENTNLRRMYARVHKNRLKTFKYDNDLVYDYESRKLTSAESFRANIQKSVFKDLNKSDRKILNVSNDIVSLAKYNLEKDSDKNEDDIKLLNNKGMQKLFNSYLTEASKVVSDEDFTYDSLISNYKNNSSLKAIVERNRGLEKYLEILQKAELTKTNTALNERMLEAKRVYPILPIKELFRNTSKLALSKTINNITDAQAHVLSKAFFEFMINKNSDITIDKIINGVCFSHVKEKDFKNLNLDSSISRFIFEVKSIKGADDMVRISSLELLLGVVNDSLRRAADVDPAVFQTLYEYSPLLQEKGKLKAENIVEGRLGKFEDEEFIGATTIRKLRRVRSVDVKKSAYEQAKTSLTDYVENSAIGKGLMNYSNIFKNFKKEVSEAKDYRTIAKSVTNMFKATVQEIKSNSIEVYRAATNQFNKIEDKINELSNLVESEFKNKAPNIKKEMLKEIDKYIQEINRLISLENQNKENELNRLKEISNELSNNINDPYALIKLEKDISKIVKRRDIEIKTLEAFKNKLIKTRNSIAEIDVTDANLNIGDFLKNIKSTFKSLLSEAKQILDKINLENQSQAAEDNTGATALSSV